MSILDWRIENRPRERLIAAGPSALSDAELLAIFLRTGTRGKTAVDLANQLLTQFGSLNQLLTASQTRFCAEHGLGTSKYATLQAVLEMARRATLEGLKHQPLLNSPNAVQQYLQLWLRNKPFEVFVALYLDTQNQLIEIQELFRGTINQTAVYPREVVKNALAMNAAGVLFAHNHPSGCAEPSRADQLLTQTLKTALSVVDIDVIDHFIVAGASFYSFAQHGHL